MAVYKIPQDVEADDKFVGPLSFKQFLYVGIAVICCYLSFLSLTKGFWPALVVFLPVIIVFGFLGFPWGRDQPTEIWLAARIRFFLKPRVRIWNQSGIKELVTITVPKKIERHLTNGLSQDEVGSRLTGLADLLDSRGWAVKNVNASLYNSPIGGGASDDRLIDVGALAQEVVEVTANNDVLDEQNNPTAQHFDEMIRNSEQKHREEVLNQLQAVRNQPAAAQAPVAAPVAATPLPPTMTTTGPQVPSTAKDAVLQQLAAARNDNPIAQRATPDQPAAKTPAKQGSADFWFLQQGGHNNQPQTAEPPAPSYTTFRSADMVAPHSSGTVPLAPESIAAVKSVTSDEEQALLQKIHKDHDGSHNPFGNIKTIQPLNDDDDATQMTPAADSAARTTPAITPQTAPQIPTPTTRVTPVTPPVNPAIMNLASNDDLNVATLARQANDKRPPNDEVVISLR